MDRVIDLDDAASVITDARRALAGGQIRFGATLWRDEDGEFNEGPLNAVRHHVSDPCTVRVNLIDTHGEDLAGIVLYRGGWVELWHRVDGQIACSCRDVGAISTFRSVLTDVVKAVAGPRQDSWAR